MPGLAIMPRLRKHKDALDGASDLRPIDLTSDDGWQGAPFGLPPSFKRFIALQGLIPRLIEPRWPEAMH